MYADPVPSLSQFMAVRNGVRMPALPLAPLASSRQAPWDGMAMEEHRLPPMELDEFSFERHMIILARPETPKDVGDLFFRVNGKPFRTRFSGEQLCTIGAGQAWSGSKSFTARGLVVGLKPAVVEHAAEELAIDPRSIEIKTSPGADDPQVVRIMKTLRSEMDAGFPGGRLFGDALQTALAVQLVKAHTVRKIDAKPLKGGLPPRRLRKVLDYVDANLSADPTLEEMASVAGLSTYHFARMFKESTGKSPHQYVLHRRVEAAKKRLHASRTPLSELSAELGFSHQSHFTNVFRRLVGETPGAYRRAMAW